MVEFGDHTFEAAKNDSAEVAHSLAVGGVALEASPRLDRRHRLTAEDHAVLERTPPQSGRRSGSGAAKNHLRLGEPLRRQLGRRRAVQRGDEAELLDVVTCVQRPVDPFGQIPDVLWVGVLVLAQLALDRDKS